ncbi:hypothetical protein ACLX1H_011303 [Fusarium chlamydosporum]
MPSWNKIFDEGARRIAASSDQEADIAIPDHTQPAASNEVGFPISIDHDDQVGPFQVCEGARHALAGEAERSSTTNIYNINCPNANINFKQEQKEATRLDGQFGGEDDVSPRQRRTYAGPGDDFAVRAMEDIDTGTAAWQEAETPAILDKFTSFLKGMISAVAIAVHPTSLWMIGFTTAALGVPSVIFGWGQVCHVLDRVMSLILPFILYNHPPTTHQAPSFNNTDTLTLSFRRPIPTTESNVIPVALAGWWDNAKGINVLLDDKSLDASSIAKAQHSAEMLSEFNRRFIPEMEITSNRHQGQLHSLVQDITAAVARYDMLVDKPRWFWQQETSLQKDAVEFQSRLLAIVDEIDASRRHEKHSLEALQADRDRSSIMCDAKNACDN